MVLRGALALLSHLQVPAEAGIRATDAVARLMPCEEFQGVPLRRLCYGAFSISHPPDSTPFNSSFGRNP